MFFFRRPSAMPTFGNNHLRCRFISVPWTAAAFYNRAAKTEAIAT